MINAKAHHPLLGLSVLTAFVLAFFIGFTAPASADAAKAEGFVQKLGEEALFTLEAADSNEVVIADKIRSWLNSYFDKDSIARFALGRHWRNATDSQKKEYTNILIKKQAIK